MNMTQCRQRLLMVAAVAPLALFSQIAVGDDGEYEQRICTVIDSMGAAVECVVNESEHAVDVSAGESVADAAQFCTAFSGMVEALTSRLSGSWKVRIFTPESNDTPAAVCDLN
jgi:hypothetical protein